MLVVNVKVYKTRSQWYGGMVVTDAHLFISINIMNTSFETHKHIARLNRYFVIYRYKCL